MRITEVLSYLTAILIGASLAVLIAYGLMSYIVR